MRFPLPRVSRRNFLSFSAAGLLSLPEWQPAIAAGKKAKAKSVLVLFEQGGVSHMDTFDPKPEAPAEHRTPFETIDTTVPGMRFTNLLAKTALQAKKLSVVRCMTQPKPGIGNSHPKGSQYIFSGEAPGGPEEMPDIGSVVSKRIGTEARNLPPYIMVPGTSEQEYNTKIGFLPPQHRVFKTGGKPHEPNWTVPNLALAGIAPDRFKNRADLLSNLDIGIPGADKAKDAKTLASMRDQAEDMLTNPATRKAFDLKAEPQKIRESYGLGTAASVTCWGGSSSSRASGSSRLTVVSQFSPQFPAAAT
ncbi:MAG: DUF1501 domain-containing protein [Gemmataceae bacterium]